MINNENLTKDDFIQGFTNYETFEKTYKINLHQLFCFLLSFEVFEIDKNNKNVIFVKNLYNKEKSNFISFKNPSQFLKKYIEVSKYGLNNKLQIIHDESPELFNTKESTLNVMKDCAKNTVLDPSSNIHIACHEISSFFDVFIPATIQAYNLEYKKTVNEDEIGLLISSLDELCVSQILEFYSICKFLSKIESENSDVYCGSVY